MTDHDHRHDAVASNETLTKNQRLVLAALEKAGGPLGAYSILDELRSQGFRAPLQVYRALDKLLETGLVHRLESMNAFVVCVHPDCHSTAMTAFAICERCGAVEEFSDAVVEAHLADWARERDFRPARTTLEIKGVCRACVAAN